MKHTQNRWRALHVINLGTFMSTLDVGIVNVALPTMAAQFSVTLAQSQWIVTSYLLTMVALLPFMGKLSDRFDRRKIYSYGFLVFGVGSLMIALSTGLVSIIVSRCIQGLGATMIMANSQAMVRQLFPNNERGKALGINAVVIALGTLLGPAVGGLMLGYMSWPALFLINVPFAIVAMVLGLAWFPHTVRKRLSLRELDILGSVVLALGAVLLLLAVEYGQENGLSALSISMFGAGCILIVALLLYEYRIKEGIIDPILYTNRPIFIGNASAFFMHAAQVATMIPITFYMQHVLGYSTVMIGALLALQPICMGIIAPLAGWYRDRFGASAPVVVGPLFCALAMIPVFMGETISFVAIVLHLTLFGIGFGFFQAPNNTEIMSAAPAEKASLVGSMLALIRYLGMVIGMGVAALFAGNLGAMVVDEAAMTGNIQLIFWCGLFICLAVACFGGMKRRFITASERAESSK